MSENTDPQNNWHGWAYYRAYEPKECKAMHVGPLPERKRIALYMEGKGACLPLAYFTSPESATAFIKWMDTLVEAKSLKLL